MPRERALRGRVITNGPAPPVASAWVTGPPHFGQVGCSSIDEWTPESRLRCSILQAKLAAKWPRRYYCFSRTRVAVGLNRLSREVCSYCATRDACWRVPSSDPALALPAGGASRGNQMPIDPETLVEVARQTEVVRPPKQALATFGITTVAYYLLTEPAYADVLPGAEETVVREGKVTAERPQIVTPYYLLNLFRGFEHGQDYARYLVEEYGPQSPGLMYSYRNECARPP